MAKLLSTFLMKNPESKCFYKSPPVKCRLHQTLFKSKCGCPSLHPISAVYPLWLVCPSSSSPLVTSDWIDNSLLVENIESNLKLVWHLASSGIPDICQFWDTNMLFSTLKAYKKVRTVATKKTKLAKIGQRFAFSVQKKGISLKKAHHRQQWRWWQISATSSGKDVSLNCLKCLTLKSFWCSWGFSNLRRQDMHLATGY